MYAYVGGDPVNWSDPTGEIWGVAFAAADLIFQLYMNDGNLKCVDWGEVGFSLLGGGLTSALFKGAFRFKRGTVWYTRSGKRMDPHSWDATRKWMDKEGIQPLKPGQHRHHWLCERNQGWCQNLPDWFKNQPWNTNPISDKLNSRP